MFNSKLFRVAVGALAVFFGGVALAQVDKSIPYANGYLKYETSDATILVAPPINRWHPSKSMMETTINRSFDVYKSFGMEVDKLISLTHITKGESKFRPNRTEIKDDNDLMALIRNELAQKKYRPANGSWLQYSIFGPMIDVTPSEQVKMAQFQSAIFNASATSYSPLEQANQASGGEVLNKLVNFGLNVAFHNALGASPSSVTGMQLNMTSVTPFVNLNTSAIKLVNGGALVKVPSEFGAPLTSLSSVPVLDVPAIDFTGYKKIKYRMVAVANEGQVSAGDIYIAYKNEPTPEQELKTEAKAVYLSFGLEQTKEQVEAAREAELNKRQKIWEECQKVEACKTPG